LPENILIGAGRAVAAKAIYIQFPARSGNRVGEVYFLTAGVLYMEVQVYIRFIGENKVEPWVAGLAYQAGFFRLIVFFTTGK
jgi:hypothetical protein